MAPSGRLILVIPACAVLAWMGAVAVRLGTADSVTNEALSAMASWSARKVQPPLAEWLAVRNGLHAARRASPGNPAVYETLGVLHFQRAGTHELIEVAHEEFVAAVAMRPTTPYGWASIAATRYALGKTDATFEAALINAIRLGPSEAEVQATVVDLGLAVWEEVAPITRAAIERAVASGMARSPGQILQISHRRGRLEPACRHVSGSNRTIDTKWGNLCVRRRSP